MDKLTKYIDCYVPTKVCNFKCHYCYLAQTGRFENKMASFPCSISEVCRALSRERLGGVCLINLCAGGETLLAEDVLELAKEFLLEGHYVSIVTNGSLSKRFEEISTWDSKLLHHLFIKFSFHYLELKRLNLLDVFVNNVNLMRGSGCSVSIEVTPSDELIPYIDNVKDFCMEHFGALCHITIARDDNSITISHLSGYSFEQYCNIWKTFSSELFDFKRKIFYKKRKEFCYAGDWSLYVNLGTGDYYQCQCGLKLGNIYKNNSSHLNLCAIGNRCRVAHCYNGHVYLTLGDIPDIEAPTYFDVRNRKTHDGTEWVVPDISYFFRQKLYENNKQYSKCKKSLTNIKSDILSFSAKSKRIPGKIKSVLRK